MRTYVAHISDTTDEKRMKLRYAGICRLCGRELPARVEAVYERATKTVRCVERADGAKPESNDIGTPGGSARREYDRRHANREQRIRAKQPKLDGLILGLTDDPQSTTAWQSGAIGEERLGHRLNELAADTLRVLHDRRIPGTRANIDHIAVTPNGTYVIDAKKARPSPHGIVRMRESGRRRTVGIVENEVELISDGDGIAVIGERKAVERFLEAEGLPSKNLGLPRLSKILALGTAGAQAAADVAANSGRWVKLTEESAQKVKQFGLTPTKTPGISHAMIGKPGASRSWLQIEKGAGLAPKNPALLANAPALMAQLAMQQAMDEITEYLASIDAKLDDVLRAQKDTVLAQMIGIGLQIEEAMTIREHVGRVNEVTWSKVQDAAGTIADTQAYALLQLDALAEKLERKSSIADLMKTAKEAETKTREWLAVLARCFQLQEGIAVLELDRVLETAPEDLDGHRQGLKAARQDRLDTITRTTKTLMARIQAAAGDANSRVLFNPIQSPAVVQSSAQVTASVVEFHQHLAIESSATTSEAKRWTAAAKELKERALAQGAEGVGAAKRRGGDALGKAQAVKGKVAGRLADRRLRGGTDDSQSET